MAGIIVAVAIVVFVVVLVARTAMAKPPKSKMRPVEEGVDAQSAALHLSEIVKFKTISYADRSAMDWGEFDRLHDYLEKAYPHIHARLAKETTDMRFLIYHLEGSNPSLAPIALLAHQDVVPADEGEWSVPPFGGEIRDDYVYGRGTMDMKGQLIAVMESVESLLAEGFCPARGIYLLFGADEEPMGEYGAGRVSKLLEERGIRLHFVLDEGCGMQDGKAMGVDGDVALVGLCEKGIMNLRFTARGHAGHASMPPTKTPVGELARAVEKIEKNQMKPEFNSAANAMFTTLTPYMNSKFKFLFANKWLFGELLKRMLTKKPAMAALLRTTFAPTQLAGSNAPNVLAGKAEAVFNIRLAPGQTEDDVYAHVDHLTGGMERETVYYCPPSPVSGVDTQAYREVSAAVCDAFPEMAAVAPGMMIAATDSRYYYNICDNVFRFIPFPAAKEDMRRVHGRDERMQIESLGRGIAFYKHLIRTTCGGKPEK
ncbi:M20/M25/M40 family metallo-hydrolase [Christensenellaceae bacterium OttesenSCG-928-K19]|nr:M20/M25/M40 family metallo-hydrolase [Christensenellaceae bacterium OttesenSCG-928-K19]